MASDGQDVAKHFSELDSDSDLDLCDAELPSEKWLREVGTLRTSEQLGQAGKNKEETGEHVTAPAGPNLLEDAEDSNSHKDPVQTEQQDPDLPEYDTLEELQPIERTDRGQKGANRSQGTTSSGPSLVVADGGKGPGPLSAKAKSKEKSLTSPYALKGSTLDTSGKGKQPVRKCVSFPAFNKLDKDDDQLPDLPEYDTLEELDTSAGPGPDRGRKGAGGEDGVTRAGTDDTVMVNKGPRPGSTTGKIKSTIAKAGRTSPYPKGHTPPDKSDTGKKPLKKSTSSPAVSMLDQEALQTIKERARMYHDYMMKIRHTVDNPQQDPEILSDSTVADDDAKQDPETHTVNDLHQDPETLPDITDSQTSVGNVVVESFNVMCEACMVPHGHNSMVECCLEHMICTQCVEKAAKTALKGESKGSVICCKDDCSSSIPQSELRKALPSLVLDLLEERWRSETLDALEDMKDVVKCDVCGFSGVLDMTIKQFDCLKCKKRYCRYCQMEWHQKQHDLCFKTKARKLPDTGAVVEIPAHWLDDSDRAMQCSVVLSKRSHEYKEISSLFYAGSMQAKARIVEIHRIQNLRLWDRYYLTRSHFVADLGELHIRELRLFHGTGGKSVKAICEQGFDWRLCGKNGTKFGDGTYFAKYSTYSHQYSDKGQSNPTTTNPFGGAIPTSTTNPFGGAIPTSTTNPFGGAIPTSTTNPFGGALPTSSKNSFGGAFPTSSNNPFGGALPTSTTNPFGGAPPTFITNPFGGALPTSTINPLGAAPPTTTMNQFGGAQPISTNLQPFGGAPPTSANTNTVGFPFGGAQTTSTSTSTGASSQQSLAAANQAFWLGTAEQSSRTSSSGFTFGLTQQSSSSSGSGVDTFSVSTPVSLQQNSNSGNSTLLFGAQTLSSSTGHTLPQPTLPSNTSGPSSSVQSSGQSGVFPTSTSTAGRSAFMPGPPSGSHLFVKPFKPRTPPGTSSSGTSDGKGIEDTGDYVMFVGRVLVGRTCKGHHGMRRPEKDPDSGSMCHTAVDMVNSPKVFVIFDMAQCYPEYLVRYRDRTD